MAVPGTHQDNPLEPLVIAGVKISKQGTNLVFESEDPNTNFRMWFDFDGARRFLLWLENNYG